MRPRTTPTLLRRQNERDAKALGFSCLADFILESKFECDQTNHLLGTTKVRSASTKTGWKWYYIGSGASSSSKDGKCLHGGNLLHVIDIKNG